MDLKLPDVLVCPVCKGRLLQVPETGELACLPCMRAFPLRDGIPDMIPHDARELTEQETAALRARTPASPRP